MSKRTVEFIYINSSVDAGEFHPKGDRSACAVASCMISLDSIDFPDNGGKERSALLKLGYPMTIAEV